MMGNDSNEASMKRTSFTAVVHILLYSLQNGPFAWTEVEQGLVLGSYFWGYLITQVPGGWLAEQFGGKWIFFGAVVLNIVATLLSPGCSQAGFEYLIIMRILEGLGAGVTFPAMNVLISKWAPKEERSTISSIAFGGMFVCLICVTHFLKSIFS